MDEEFSPEGSEDPRLVLETDIGSWAFCSWPSDDECLDMNLLGEEEESTLSWEENDDDEEKWEDGSVSGNLPEGEESTVGEETRGGGENDGGSARGAEPREQHEEICPDYEDESPSGSEQSSARDSSGSDSRSTSTSDSEESYEGEEILSWSFLEAFPGGPVESEGEVETNSEEPSNSDSTTDSDEDQDGESKSEDDEASTVYSSSCSVEFEEDSHRGGPSVGHEGLNCNCRYVKGLLTHDRGCALDNEFFWAILQWTAGRRYLWRSPLSYRDICRLVCYFVGDIWTASGSYLFHLARLFERELTHRINEQENAFLSVFLYCESIRKGHIPALVCLARLFEFGTFAMSPSRARARNLYRRVARLSHPSALYAAAFLEETDFLSSPSATMNEASHRGDIHALCRIANHVSITEDPSLWHSLFDRDAFNSTLRLNHCYFCVNIALYGLAKISFFGGEEMEEDICESVRLLRLLVDRGHVVAHHLLACILQDGEGDIEKNEAEALKLYTAVTEHTQYDQSWYQLGILLEDGGIGVKRDLAMAMRCFKLAGRLGNADAYYRLAMMHHHGERGLPVNGKKAERFYRAAAEQGHKEAMAALAVLVGNGSLGVSSNPEEAKRLFRKAVEEECFTGQLKFSSALLYGSAGVRQDEEESYSLLSKLSDSGDVAPLLNLGFFHLGGHLKGQERLERAKGNWREAERFFRIATDGDWALGIYSLGCLNVTLDWDYEERMQLFRIAASSGDPEALYRLAISLRFGPLSDQIQGCLSIVVGLLREAIENGSKYAPCDLGKILKEGYEDIEGSPAEAKLLFSEGISRGDPEAAYQLGNMLEFGDENVPRDFPLALEMYERAKDMGNVSALLRLADLYADGSEDLPTDRPRAVELYSEAIKVGDTYSMFKLASLFHFGYADLPLDTKEAKRLYRMAIEKGHIYSLYGLGDLMEAEGESKEAFELYERAANQGNMDARLRLAYMLFDGADGVKKNVTRALELLRSCVEEGMEELLFGTNVKFFSPQVALGDIKENGSYGVPKDAAEAAALYHTAAENEQPEGYMLLGMLLERGDEGVSKDPAAAVEYYRLAIEAGVVPCFYYLGRLLERGDEGVEKNVEGAISLYENAIRQGNTEAMHRLAEIYEHGHHGVQQNLYAAGSLYGLAGQTGKAESSYNLGLLLFYGRSGVRRDKKRGRKFLQMASLQGSGRARWHLWRLRVRRLVTFGVVGFFCIKFAKLLRSH